MPVDDGVLGGKSDDGAAENDAAEDDADLDAISDGPFSGRLKVMDGGAAVEVLTVAQLEDCGEVEMGSAVSVRYTVSVTTTTSVLTARR